jgi:hypothetical protein
MHDGDPGRARNARRRRLGRGGSEVVTDPGARLPAFHQFLDALVARALNASIGRWEAFWDPNSYSAVALASPADIIDKASYGLADLKGPLPDRATLKLTAPPGFESVEAFREQVAVVHHRAESTSAGASRLSSPPSPGRRRGRRSSHPSRRSRTRTAARRAECPMPRARPDAATSPGRRAGSGSAPTRPAAGSRPGGPAPAHVLGRAAQQPRQRAREALAHLGAAVPSCLSLSPSRPSSRKRRTAQETVERAHESERATAAHEAPSPWRPPPCCVAR